MTPALWQRLKPLFAEALERSPACRDQYIEEACAGEPALEQHLRALLEAEQEATGPIGVPANLEPALHAALACFQPGQLILGRFRIIRYISGGGMGEVYEADDLELGTKVALKTVRADIADSPDALRRLRQEVQLAQRITGTSICRVHNFFTMPADQPHGPTAFISMEYIEGETLASRLHTHGPMPGHEALRIALELCHGLSLIHDQGIIHRDLKTANIMLSGPPGAERTVLMDFGLAHTARRKQSPAESLAATDNSGNSLAFKTGIVGTPAYMAPEQFSGEPVSPATDIYALGIVLYELATGVQPYSASTPFAAAANRGRKPLPIATLRPNFPRHWDRVVEGCLQHEPTERFQTAEEVAEALNPSRFNLDNLWHDRRGLVQATFAIILCAIAWVSLLAWQALIIYRPTAEAARSYRNGIEAFDDATYLKATHALNAAVERDPHFAIAHVRLAEAWNSLDFQVEAQHELLLATPGAHRLSPRDTLQLEAVHSEVTGDFPNAIAARERLIAKLPHDELSAAYVELGFDRERDAQPEGALADYLKATSLDSENASAYLHAAILQSRLNRTTQGQQSFDHAEAIYRTQINQEGLANLHYERGYAANVLGDTPTALRLLNQSLQEAQQIPSVQLQIRTLQQLSSATRSDNSKSIAYATDAIHLARENRLDSWAAIALVRLAAAQTRKGDFEDSRKTTYEGLQLAKQTQQLRVEALANSQLANLENQTGNSAEVIAPATAARDYYRKNGFFDSAVLQSLLIGRAQRGQGHFDEALQTAEETQQLATESGDRSLQSIAEELTGTVYQSLENYPMALDHFRRASELTDSSSLRQYRNIMISGILWRLGRYKEFEDQLHFEPATPPIRAGMTEERARAAVSAKHFSQVLALIQSFSSQSSDLASEFRENVQTSKLLAEANFGYQAEALRDLKVMNADVSEQSGIGRQHLASAQVKVALGQTADAEVEAHAAAQWFQQRKLLDSELQSVALEALCAENVGHLSTAGDLRRRCVDIIATIRKTWPPDDVVSYLSRPDIKALLVHRT